MAARKRQTETGQEYSLATRLLRADGNEVAVEITSTMVQRDDLRRFRIVTVLQRPDEPAVTVHVAGKIRLVGLDEVKEALGSRWAAVAERAMASAEHVVRRRCGPHDTWSRSSDGGFLICFADATEEEAAFRAAAMAREIRTRLIGDGETEATATVSAITARWTCRTSRDAPPTCSPPPSASGSTAGWQRSRRARGRRCARRWGRRPAGWSRCAAAAHVRSWRISRGFRSELEQRLLAAYATLPISERQDFDFDRLVLGVAAEQAITEIAEGGSLLIMVNVDFEVFLDRRRTERYVAACQALDNRLRERLVLILSGMPRGCPKSRVLECVMRLRPFCHGVGFQSDSMEAPSVELSVLGAAIVVLRQEGRAPGDPGRLSKADRQPARLPGPRPGPSRGILGGRQAARQAGRRPGLDDRGRKGRGRLTAASTQWNIPRWVRSFHVARMNSPASNARPARKPYSCARAGIGRPRIASAR